MNIRKQTRTLGPLGWGALASSLVVLWQVELPQPAPSPLTPPSPPLSSLPQRTFTVEHLGTGSQTLPVVQGEALIQLTSLKVLPELQKKLLEKGSRILQQAGTWPLVRVSLPDGQTLASFMKEVESLEGVASVAPNAVMEATSATYRAYQWNLDRIELPQALLTPAPLSQKVVAVLDTGVAFETHMEGTTLYNQAPDLASTSFVAGYDFVNDDLHPGDDHQHGTHIAGIIAASGGIDGVAHGVSILPVKVLGADKLGTEFQLIQGIHFAVDHGADVINMSLSFGAGYFPSSGLEQAIAHAVDNGVMLVGSSGNAGEPRVGFPGAFHDVIAVGASALTPTSDGALIDARASYSNYGAGIDVVAPGGLLTADYNDDGQPDGILAQTIQPGDPSSFGYWYYAGTSQATAHVSAMAAWLLADGFTPEQAELRLKTSGLALDSSTYSLETGDGLVRLHEARQLTTPSDGLSPWYVNIVSRLVADADGLVRAVARVELLSAAGVRAVDTQISGSWYGSALSAAQVALSDASGVAYFESPAIDPSEAANGIALGFRIMGAGNTLEEWKAPIFQHYSLSPAMAEVMAQLIANPTHAAAGLLFELDPTDAALDALFSREGMLRSWLIKPVGAGLRSGPMAIVCTDAFVPELSNPAPDTASALSLQWPAPLYSGWGPLSALTLTEVQATVPHLGSLQHYLLLPLDPALGSVVVGETWPVVNAYASSWAAHNATFGNAFASSALGDGFASSTLGDAFASSTLGDAFASSTLGDGFASSTLGDAFASSTLGDAFASSTLGDGFASSTLGAAFASSSLGDAFASSSMANGGSSVSGSSSRTNANATDLAGIAEQTDAQPELEPVQLGTVSSEQLLKRQNNTQSKSGEETAGVPEASETTPNPTGEDAAKAEAEAEALAQAEADAAAAEALAKAEAEAEALAQAEADAAAAEALAKTEAEALAKAEAEAEALAKAEAEAEALAQAEADAAAADALAKAEAEAEALAKAEADAEAEALAKAEADAAAADALAKAEAEAEAAEALQVTPAP